MPKTEEERKALLVSLGLNPEAPALDAAPKSKKKKEHVEVQTGVDYSTMPVSDIVFDPALLDDFPDLSGANYKAASAHIFEMYKAKGRDKDRHALLHRKITEFIGEVKRSRKTGGFVKEKVKATSEERELANLLAAHGVTLEKLTEMLQAEEAK